MGYVVVRFSERREVFIDDESQGDNLNDVGVPRALLVGDGVHTVRLGGLRDYNPMSQTVNVVDSTIIRPFPVVFHRNP
jgi:hypothetical protein